MGVIIKRDTGVEDTFTDVFYKCPRCKYDSIRDGDMYCAGCGERIIGFDKDGEGSEND